MQRKYETKMLFNKEIGCIVLFCPGFTTQRASDAFFVWGLPSRSELGMVLTSFILSKKEVADVGRR